MEETYSVLSSSDKGKQGNEKKAKSSQSVAKKTVSRIFLLRSLLIASLIAAVVICASLSYKLLTDAEKEVGVQTYKSIASSATTGAKAITQRKIQGSEVMATLMSQILPDKADWPYISVEGYIPIAVKVAQLSSSTTQALMVVHDPSQFSELEVHAKDEYELQGRPESAGVNDFGFGIWKPDKENGNRSHDTTGVVSWEGSKRSGLVMTTLLFHNQPGASSLLYNVYSEADRGLHIDSMMDCIEQNTNSSASPQCAVVTDMLELKVQSGPAGLLFQPIYPAHDPSAFVGFATTSIHFEEVLFNVVPDYVNGLTCVISTDTITYTYEISNGVPKLIGEGDLHDDAYTEYAESVVLTDIPTGALKSAKYVLTVYPTKESFDAFASSSPLAVSLGFCGAVLFVTLVFFLYDYLMRRDAEQRKAILEMKRRFVRFISHEIRTPLNTVCMGLELLGSELRGSGFLGSSGVVAEDEEEKLTKEDVDFWQNVVEDVDENAHIAVTILNDLLNYDKLETGTLKLETGIVFIWDAIQRTVNQFQIQAVNRKVNLNFSVEKPKEGVDLESGLDLWNVMGDDVRLCQVFRNVISNALKFTPPDGNVEVTASYITGGLLDAKSIEGEEEFCMNHPRAGSIQIAVKDSGVGLSKDQLQQLFAEGVQFDANRLQHGGGSGLGLNIAKGLVEQHFGTIWAESEGIGHGTTFIIELPLYRLTLEELKNIQEEDGRDSKSQHTGTTEATTTASGNMDSKDEETPHRILVAEDAASSRKMLIRLLERAGHTCVPATNGKEALEMIAADIQVTDAGHIPIDTIMMDYEMPLLTGPEATQKIREIGYKGTIIGVTGNVLEEDVDFFKGHGADEVLPKPVSMDLIKKVFGKRELDRSLRETF